MVVVVQELVARVVGATVWSLGVEILFVLPVHVGTPLAQMWEAKPPGPRYGSPMVTHIALTVAYHFQRSIIYLSNVNSKLRKQIGRAHV